MARIIATRIYKLLIWLYWYAFLSVRVTGRLKLKGDLRKLKVDSKFRCEGDLWLGIYKDGGIITIKQNVSASGPLIITAIRSVEICDGVLFGPNVLVTDHYHGNVRSNDFFNTAPAMRPLYSPGEIRIGFGCHLGANSVVLSPSEIGSSVVIGANSVVKGVLPNNSIHAGAPAKIIQ